jgi:hypothetical protein
MSLSPVAVLGVCPGSHSNARVLGESRGPSTAGLLRYAKQTPSLRMTAAHPRTTSGNFSFGQFSYQLQVSFQKIERWQLRANRPAHVFENPILDFALILTNCIEAQFDS